MHEDASAFDAWRAVAHAGGPCISNAWPSYLPLLLPLLLLLLLPLLRVSRWTLHIERMAEPGDCITC